MEAQKERMINENETYLGDAACVFCGAQPLLNAAERTSFYSLYCPRGCGVSVSAIGPGQTKRLWNAAMRDLRKGELEK